MALQFRTSLVRASVLFLLVSIVSPRVVSAMEIAMYDQMASQDQREYLKFLLKATEKVLMEQGKPDLAAQAGRIFSASSDRPSIGERQFQEGLKFIRTFNAEHPDSPFPLSSVEDAFGWVWGKNNIPILGLRDFSRRLAETIREHPFWPKQPLRTN